MIYKKLPTPRVYTSDDISYLKKLRPHTKAHWNNQSKEMKSIKANMKSRLYDNQKGYCAYCNDRLPPKKTVMSSRAFEREHFIDKAKYPDYTFYRLNLFLSCTLCNDHKHRYKYDFLVKRGPTYKKSKFLIIHPYIDNPQDHIRFHGCLISFIDEKGKHTIQCFELAEDYMVEKRANILSRQNDKGTIALTEEELDIIINYRTGDNLHYIAN